MEKMEREFLKVGNCKIRWPVLNAEIAKSNFAVSDEIPLFNGMTLLRG